MSKNITQSALFEYSASHLYNIVNDIEKYPEFIDGCTKATIISSDTSSDSNQQMLGKLVLKRSGVMITVTTKNTMIPNQRIDMTFIDGTLKNLWGSWIFKPLNENACKVTLAINYQFSNPIKNIAADKLIKPLSNDLISAIAKRCKQLQ